MHQSFHRVIAIILLAFISVFNLAIPSDATDLLWADGVPCSLTSSCDCCMKACCCRHEAPARSPAPCFRSAGCADGNRALKEGVVCPALDQAALVSEGEMALFGDCLSRLNAADIQTSLLCARDVDKPPRLS